MKTEDTFGVDQKTVDAFYQQWDNFPEFAALIRKDRRVIALNKAARDMGFPQGIRCVEIGGPEVHKECLANKALEERTAKSLLVNSKMPGSKTTMITYWLPLSDKDDLYVHCNIDITKFADQKKVDKHEGVIKATPSKALQFSSYMFFKLFNKKWFQ